MYTVYTIHANYSNRDMGGCPCLVLFKSEQKNIKIWAGGSPCLVRGCCITSSATQPLEQTSLNLFKTGDGTRTFCDSDV